MIRLSILTIFLTTFSLYAFKDWYKSLCCLILFTGVIEHPDVPKSMLGIQGLNPWNILLFFVIMGWLANRNRTGSNVEFIHKIKQLFCIYMLVIVISAIRMLLDKEGLIEWAVLNGRWGPTTKELISEHIINCFKWVIPGILLYDGCKTRKDFVMGLAALLGLYFVLAVQVIKWMPLSVALSGGEMSERSAKILLNEIGYHRVNLSMMLCGASWAIFCSKELVNTSRKVLLVISASAVVFFAMLLTAGRTGYGTWVVVGSVLCFIRWKKLFLIAPVLVILFLSVVPGAWERLTKGFSQDTHDTSRYIEDFRPQAYSGLNKTNVDFYTVTSGRTFAWPFVIDKIMESPLMGYGKEAMLRTGLSRRLWIEYEEEFPHPHNMYLQSILDNGLIGTLPILIFYFVVLRYSLSLFKEKEDTFCIAIGGVCLSLVLSLLVAGIGSQTFYPREGSVGMWCAIGLMLRVYSEKARFQFESKGQGIWSSGRISCRAYPKARTF